MDDAPQESEPFADVFTVAPNLLLADLGVQGEEGSNGNEPDGSLTARRLAAPSLLCDASRSECST